MKCEEGEGVNWERGEMGEGEGVRGDISRTGTDTVYKSSESYLSSKEEGEMGGG